MELEGCKPTLYNRVLIAVAGGGWRHTGKGLGLGLGQDRRLSQGQAKVKVKPRGGQAKAKPSTPNPGGKTTRLAQRGGRRPKLRRQPGEPRTKPGAGSRGKGAAANSGERGGGEGLGESLVGDWAPECKNAFSGFFEIHEPSLRVSE